MDGTLIDSSPAVVVAWGPSLLAAAPIARRPLTDALPPSVSAETMKETYPFIDLDHILKSAHVRPAFPCLASAC
jgi:hypothetical protein